MASVDYNAENAALCLCYDCPVQSASTCAQGKYGPVAGSLGRVDPPSAADLPGLYCASGKATCGDLDFSGECQCFVCSVYSACGLGRWKYCEDGAASSLG